jgi:hypothetical protein
MTSSLFLSMVQYLFIRMLAFGALALLVVTAPWYVALFVLCVWTLCSQWYELLVLAAVVDVLGGFGLTHGGVPIATVTVVVGALLHSLVAPVLLPRSRALSIQ